MRPMCQMLVIVLLFLAERLTHVLSLQSPYIAVITGRLCCTHSLVLSNASLLNLYTIIFSKPGVAFSQSSFIFVFALSDSPLLLQSNSLLPMIMLCLPGGVCLVDGCCCPSLIYSIEINLLSIFMSLNIAICGYMRIKK